MRKTNDRIADYTNWLHELRATTEAFDIPLIFDEVYTGFRMAPGGAQEFYNVSADYVVYGKTLGGGLPVGVVCGKKHLMHRFDKVLGLRREGRKKAKEELRRVYCEPFFAAIYVPRLCLCLSPRC